RRGHARAAAGLARPGPGARVRSRPRVVGRRRAAPRRAGAVRVNDLEHEAPFRYLRFRDPPYSDDDLARWAERVRAIDVPVYAYFRHEEKPTAPTYAARFTELL